MPINDLFPTKQGGAGINSLFQSNQPTSAGGLFKTTAPDLTSTEGLYNLSQQVGGNVGSAGNSIMQPEQSFFGKVGSFMKSGLQKTLDILQRPNFAIASAVKNTIDDDPNSTFLGGLGTGITGQTKTTFHDVFTEAGWNPDTRLGRIAKGVTSFAADVLLDPTTYVTFGVGAGVKVGEETLTKAGAKLLAKGVAQGAGKEFGEQFVKEAIVNMAEKSPELYAKFIDQGGVKFFGKTLISGGRIAGVARAIPGMTKLDEATQPVRNTLYALFNRDASAKFGKLPQEFIDLKQKYLDLGKSKSADAIDQVMKIAQANKLTTQEAEIISNAIEAGLPLADDRLDNARKLFQQILGKDLKEEVKRGITKGDLPNYVPHILVEEAPKNIPFKPEGARVALGASKERTIEGTIEEINSKFGKEFFDPNVVKTVANRNLASAKATTAYDFLDEVAKKFGAEAGSAPSNYVAAGAKELDGLVFHPAIAEQLDKFKSALINDEATNNLLKYYDKLQNLWKASVTTIFPAFHGRNALSNVFLNFLDLGGAALSPAKHFLASEILYKEGQVSKLEKLAYGVGEEAARAKIELHALLGEKIMTDKMGQEWTYADLRHAIKDNNVAFSGEYTGMMDIQDTVAEKLGQTETLDKVKQVAQKVNPFSQQNIAVSTGRAVGTKIEEQARILNFITNLEKTGDVMTSAQRTKQFLFDYTNLSPFEKTFMRRVIPFYTFTRKNIELQLTQLVKQPGKYATQAKVFNTASAIMSDAQLTDEERDKLPDYLKSGLGLVMSKNGSKVEIVNSLGTPFEQIFQALQPNQLLSSLSPAIGVPLQVATKRNFFQGKPLDDVNDASAFKSAPQFIKDYIGFTTRKNKDGSERYIALNPTRLFIMSNLPPTTRIIGSVRQLEQENVSGKLKIIQQLTGVKPYAKDLEDEASYQDKQKFRELQDLLDKAGIAPTFTRSFVPKK